MAGAGQDGDNSSPTTMFGLELNGEESIATDYHQQLVCFNASGDTECTERMPIIHSRPTPAPVMSAQHLRWSGDIEQPDIPRETVISDTAIN